MLTGLTSLLEYQSMIGHSSDITGEVIMAQLNRNTTVKFMPPYFIDTSGLKNIVHSPAQFSLDATIIFKIM